MTDSSRESTRAFKTRGLQPEDLSRIPPFMALFDEPDVTSDRRFHDAGYYRWKYYDPPKPAEVMVAEDGQILIGMTAVVPKKLAIKGQVTDGVEIGDTYTHSDYQGQGIFTTLVGLCQQRALERGFRFIYGTPNDQSLPPYEKRCNFAQVRSADVVSFVRPLNSRSVLQFMVRPGILAAIAAPFVSIAYGVLSRLTERREKGNILVTEVDSFPEDIGRLSEDSSRRYDVVLVRNRDYLVWRFMRNPNTYTVMVARSGGKTVGYLVTRVRSWHQLKLGCIADFLVLGGDAHVFKALIVEAFRAFRTSKVDLVYCWAVKNTSLSRVLRGLGFLPHKKIPIICYRNELGEEILRQQYTWHFTVGDSDNI